MFVRHSEHIAAFDRKDQSGFMWHHLSSNHREENISIPIDRLFRVHISGRDRDPMRRVLREAVKIRSALDGEKVDVAVETNGEGEEQKVDVEINLLNTKNEWFQPNIITLAVDEY